jgi:isopropylmalate/isohomocitrate dehydrogenase-like protein
VEGVQSILVAAGDGIGPEVVEATLFAMDGLGIDLELFMEPVGRTGMEERGEAITDQTVELAREADAVLFGAVHTPPPGVAYRSPILTLRRELGLFATVRPARPLAPWLNRLGPTSTGGSPPPFDVVVVRETTEGLYAGKENAVEGGVSAEKVVTRVASERIARFSLEWARAHGRRGVTWVHKANVLRESDGLFLEACRSVAGAEAGDLRTDDAHVDAIAAAMVTDPGSLDVLVAPNLYGDILSDLAAGVCGGLGLAPSASLGEAHALFEPVHGSAPDIAGKGIANPVGCMLAASMMLERLGHAGAARRFETALVATMEEGVRTPDIGGRHTTYGFAEEVRARLAGSG